ncbi:MAG TPA: class I SAM-dependent methyltransferase [Anaerolineales bacterium]|nr:class I SAM-dependent methyltransferase [Anaerolineales bacterium]
MNFRQRVFTTLYRRAQTPAALPWHREEPPVLLRSAAAARGAGRALDIGCGEGVNAVYLAGQGFSVTAVDFVPGALELARARAGEAGVEIEMHALDILDFDPPDAFDLILDSGCLHHIPPAKVPAYCERIKRWLVPGGDYLLVHFLKRHALDWRPAGPRRVRREEILGWFPFLRLEASDETGYDVPFPVGRSLAGIFSFRRER